MDDVRVAKQKRNALNMNCGKQVTKVLARDNPRSEEDAEFFEASITKLSEYRVQLAQLSDQILANTEDDTLAAAEAEKSADIEETLLDCISTLKAKLATYRRSLATPQVPLSPSAASHTQSFSSRSAAVKLPKLEISKFSGDPLKFEEFWDSYSSTIHENEDLADVDKLKYLKMFVTGDARRTIEGYKLTSDNYHTVVEVLKEQYGNKQLVIFSHFEAMLSLPVATNHDSNQLQSIYNDCERHIRSLIALGLEEDMFGLVFTPIILSKLPTYVKMEIHRRNGKKAWTLQNLRELLKDEIRVRDMSSRTFGTTGHTKQIGPSSTGGRNFKQRTSTGSSASLLTTNENDSKSEKLTDKKIRCVLCNGNHYNDECQKYPDLQSRREHLSGRCFGCLSKFHIVKECTKKRQCFYCKRTTHDRCLCPRQFGTTSPGNSTSLALDSGEDGDEDVSEVDDEDESEDDDGERGQQVKATLVSHGETAILQTAVATVKGSAATKGDKARLLFDTASSRTFITTAIAKKIAATVKGKEVISTAGFSDVKRKTKEYRIVEIDVVLPDGTTKRLTANVIDSITCPIQRYPVDVEKYPIAKQLVLAEPFAKTVETVTVDILVGADYYYDFIGTERIQCSEGLVFLSSPFGFIATGRINKKVHGVDKVASMVCFHRNEDIDPTINIEKYWSLEDVGVKVQPKMTEDETALQHFKDTVKFEDGRYQVAWSYKQDSPLPPHNRALAFGRLKSLLNRIDDKVFEKYDKTIGDQLEKSVIESVPPGEPDGPVHYMPHHCVLTPGKTTTKLRVVYDASAKTNKTDQSLNECLHRGPVLLDDLCGLLMRFRLNPVALTSDIEKAFLQVGLQKNSRDVTRFLWIKDRQKPPYGDNVIEYRFTRVPFGVIESPFKLGAVVLHHLDKSDSDVAKKIKGHIYVDNVIKSLKSPEEAIKFYFDSKKIFTDASMNLREWYTNSPELAAVLKEDDRGQTETTKVLGILWDTSTDKLSCSTVETDASVVNTKRLMLKYLAKIFDPCGWFSAVTVTGKILIQMLWKQNFGWDDKLPEVILNEWKEYWINLKSISEFSLPRCLIQLGATDGVTYDLHCFGDASAKAYSAVVYLRITSKHDVKTRLIFAKSRVAPVKPLTIPRLELMATLIGCRLIAFVEKELHMKIEKKFLWSDSQCVLHWINSTTVTAPFIKNRINEIKSHSEIEFRYVPTQSNPADLSSRGCSMVTLVNSQLWWNGPDWLADDIAKWPQNIETTPRDIEKEKKTMSAPGEVTLITPSTDVYILNLAKFSNITRLLRVTGWIKRFIGNCRNPPQQRQYGELTFGEVKSAQLFWDKCIQSQYFHAVLQKKQKQPVALVKQLDLFMDQSDLLRCGGRFRFSDIEEGSKCPILLPKNDHYTNLVIQDRHERLLHAGVAHTLSQTRYHYWIINGRTQVKRVLRRCHECIRKRGGAFRVPPFPDLPDYRVSRQRAFSTVGIDYLGPLFIVSDQPDKPRTKVWLCLFTCAAIRAVHLEVIEKLSTEHFLMCFKRFCSIFGKPELIVSDNAKQFIAADKFLDKMWQHVMTDLAIQQHCTTEGIRWKFITEYSPWMGGFYERMVGVVKKTLKMTLDSRCVSLVQLQTVVLEVATIVNSRPLIYTEDDLSDVPLTPAHFINGSKNRLPSYTPPEDDYKQTTADDIVKSWRRIEAMLDKYWHVWRTQYLQSLRTAPTHHRQRSVCDATPTVGSIVLVKDNLPRSQWKMGKIVKLNVGTDGRYRSAVVELSSKKTIARPIKLLYPLELTESERPIDTVSNKRTAPKRPKRTAAAAASKRIRETFHNNQYDSDSE